MNDRLLMGGLMAVFGAVLVGGSVFQWPWFVRGRKYQRMAAAFGSRAPLVFYLVLGLVLIGMGVAQIAGLWPVRS